MKSAVWDLHDITNVWFWVDLNTLGAVVLSANSCDQAVLTPDPGCG